MSDGICFRSLPGSVLEIVWKLSISVHEKDGIISFTYKNKLKNTEEQCSKGKVEQVSVTVKFKIKFGSGK